MKAWRTKSVSLLWDKKIENEDRGWAHKNFMALGIEERGKRDGGETIKGGGKEKRKGGKIGTAIRRSEKEREATVGRRDERVEMAGRGISAQGETQEQESEKESEGCMNKQWLWIGFSCMRGRCTNKNGNIGL